MALKLSLRDLFMLCWGRLRNRLSADKYAVLQIMPYDSKVPLENLKFVDDARQLFYSVLYYVCGSVYVRRLKTRKPTDQCFVGYCYVTFTRADCWHVEHLGQSSCVNAILHALHDSFLRSLVVGVAVVLLCRPTAGWFWDSGPGACLLPLHVLTSLILLLLLMVAFIVAKDTCWIRFNRVYANEMKRRTKLLNEGSVVQPAQSVSTAHETMSNT
jgi:hypothetical protein